MPDTIVKNPIDSLATLTGSNWPNIKAAREYTQAKRMKLQEVLGRIDTDV
jgi:hypothetical protein